MIGIVNFEAERKAGPNGRGVERLRGSATTFAQADAVIRVDDETGEVSILKDRFNVFSGSTTLAKAPLVMAVNRMVDSLQGLREDLAAIADRMPQA